MNRLKNQNVFTTVILYKLQRRSLEFFLHKIAIKNEENVTMFSALKCFSTTFKQFFMQRRTFVVHKVPL